ncbi:RHS repeat protein [Actinoplanes hulinensis]|uniref:RHS repeat protein n=1 Tax=Actinoplanes hulinensis TaxID=1144547 RepID=A0ABS7BEA3_9ACTN|nr:RHS repeat-associated core domain-containing protein [Actinoplanes hulinensis]MBW6439213.1 RHS repeat protein [Actinoplanes hulinensis]
MNSSPPADRRLVSKPRITIAASLAVTLVLGLGHAPAMAAEPTPYKPQAATPVPTVPVKPVKITPPAKRADPPPASARPAPVWPKAAGEIISVPAPGIAARQADTLPVRVEQPAKKQNVPSQVQLEVLDRKATEQAGVRGVLLRLGRADGVTTAGTTKVTLDYKGFAAAYGADWSSRLRLRSLPACALTTPSKPGCEGTPLTTDNDVTAQTLSAEVAVSSASTLVAATAATSGPAGDFAATSLNASSTWSAGGNSGNFSWNYPMAVPPSLGGPAPQLALAYSSQSVDGRHAASNNQPSRVGEGFDEPSGGFIERRYKGCADDMNKSANNDKKTGDLCWETDNATLSLAGHSGELIFNTSENRWHLRGDDASRIERKTGATNGDNNGEYWILTTSDGTQYWFGINRLPGWTSGKTLTNSVLTAPVFGNDPDEPCHATAFIDSDCMQSWRWNLDYVVDTSGNSMSYWYVKKTNKYARNLEKSDAASYDREALLDHIRYGTRRSGGMDSAHKTAAPMRVNFTYQDRCRSECDTHNAIRWPDVPWDAECTGATCEDQYSPTFWSTQRLHTVTTQVRNGTGYRDVDRWTLTHTFPDPGDGTRAGLWLSKLAHEGLVGGTLATPDVEFTPVQRANRVDTTGDFAGKLTWMRIGSIRTDTGATISVEYSQQDCTAGATPSPATNTSLCYPVKWVPEGKTEPVTDWFNKYVVTEIYEHDNTGGVPPLGSPRKVYKYTYYNGAAWHYSDDDGLTKKKYQTWSDYRGFAKVGVTVGDPGQSSYTETRYFRGMNGDRLDTNTTPERRDINVDGIADEDWFAGQTRSSTTYLNGPNSAIVSQTLHKPWASAATATRTINGDTVTARYTGVESTTNRVTLDGGRGEHVTKTVNTFDEYGMIESIDDLGQDGVNGDEQCKQKTYTPRNTDAWILDRVHSVKSYAVGCDDITWTLTEAKVIGETRTSYDNQDFGTAPTKGLPTQVQEMSAWNNGAPSFVVTGKTIYDVHGRPTSITDARGYATTTDYTPGSDGPVTSTFTKNYLDHRTTTTLEPAWGTPTATVDANDKRTDTEHDPLGRLTAVWTPGRTKGSDTASIKYGYALNIDKPSVVSTSILNAAGGYLTSYALYDGLLRPRQTQSPSPSGGRILTENFYDSAGRQVLEYSAYHANGSPDGTLLTSSDAATIPTQTRTLYDGAGRAVASVFQPHGVERWRTTTAYGGDRTDVTPPSGGTAISTVTDARGRTIEQRQYADATPTPYTADSWVSTEYKYDARGYQTQLIDDLGNDWNYTYDIRGRQTEVDDPDKGIIKYTYDDLGNMLTSTDARGKKIAYAYDALGRMTDVFDDRIGGVIRAQWTYDTLAKGLLSYSTRFVGSAMYQVKIHDYNDRYQPGTTEITIPTTETGLSGNYYYTNTYNLDGSIKTTNIPNLNTDLASEELTYEYDSLGQPTTVDSLYGSTSQPYVTGTDYNALGQLDQVKLQTGTGDGRIYTQYKRELETGRLTGIRTDRNSVAPYILTDTTYQYDNAGNITKIADAAPAGDDDTQCFTHDHLARLTRAWTPGSGDCTVEPSTDSLGGPAPYWQSWTFDTIGNRTEETLHTTAGETKTGYVYPPSGSTSVRPHAVTSTTGARTGTYTYDAGGNTLTRPTESSGTQTLTWDPEGHLNTATDSTGTTTYIYDADGNRLIQRDAKGRSLYLPGQEIRYDNSTATTSCTRYYSHAGTTIGSRTSTGLTWLSPDHQGTAGIAIDATNQQATVRRQTPYGTPRGITADTWPNNRGYVGGTLDNTGLVHLGAREYDPTNGRFISVDPIQDLTNPQQWNGYSYANNTPVTLSDPGGTDPGGGQCAEDPKCNPGGDPQQTPANDDSGGGEGGGNSGGGGCDLSCQSEPAPNPKQISWEAMHNSGYQGTRAYTMGEALAWADQSESGYLFVCLNTFGYSLDVCDKGNPWKNPNSGVGTTKSLVEIAGVMAATGGIVGCAATGVVLCAAALADDTAAFAMYGGGSVLGLSATMSGVRSGTKIYQGLCGLKSFSGDTEILLANGTTKPLSEVGTGDVVLATDPETGEQGPRRVEKVWVHDDDLYELFIDGQRLVTTEDHPFWSETDQAWRDAQLLERGDLIRTPTGTVVVDGMDEESREYAPAYNLTVADLHTYYVLAGKAPVLVHNTPCKPGLFDFRAPNAAHPPNAAVTEAMRRQNINDYCLDCSEIASSLMRSADGKGRIVSFVAGSNNWLKVAEDGGRSIADFSYHHVYTDGQYAYDPRLSMTPVPWGDYMKMMRGINSGGIRFGPPGFSGSFS